MRHKNIFLIIFSLILSLNILAQCVGSVNNIYNFTFQSSAYELVKENQTWSLARNCAISRGGGLAIIESQAEQDTIFYHLNQAGITTSNTIAPDGGGAAYVWLAGNDRSSEGNWFWDVINGTNIKFWQGARNGNPVNGRYNNWGNEPDDYQGQDALGIALTSWPFGVAGEWNDLDESNTLYYLIERPLTTGLRGRESISELQVYPNPTYDEVKIRGVKNGSEVKLYDKMFSTLEHLTLHHNHNTLNLSSYSKGIYYLYINGYSKPIKIVKL